VPPGCGEAAFMGELVLVQGSAACECGGDTATSDGLLRTGPVSADAWSRYEGASGSASCGGDRSLPALDRRTCEVILTEPLDRRTGTGMLGLVARWLAPRTGVQGQGGCCCCCCCCGCSALPTGTLEQLLVQTPLPSVGWWETGGLRFLAFMWLGHFVPCAAERARFSHVSMLCATVAQNSRMYLSC